MLEKLIFKASLFGNKGKNTWKMGRNPYNASPCR
jgi:hypothetical protein